MSTSSEVAVVSGLRDEQTPAPLFAVIGWQVLLGLGCLYAAWQVLQIERIFNLGNFVQIFVALLLGFLGIASFASAVMLYQRNGNGRLIAMGLDAVTAIVFVFYALQIMGVFLGIDQLAEGIYRNIGWVWGIAIGYVVMMVGRRFPENSRPAFYIERLGIGIILLSIMAILLVPVWDPSNPLSGLLLTGLGSFISNLFRGDVLLTLLIAVVAGGAAYYLLRLSVYFNESISDRETWQGWLFLMPNFINFVLFFAGPLLLSFYLSFTDYNPAQQNPANFVGLNNYVEMLSVSLGRLESPEQSPTEVLATNHTEVNRFTIGDATYVIGARDQLFWRSLFNTIYYCLWLLILSIFPALGLAMLLNSKIPGMQFFRAIFFIPSVAAVVGVALIWQWLYDPTIGYINYTITQLANFFGFTDPNIQWLTDDSILMFSVVIMAAWQVVGFNTVIFLAGLQGIPKDVMEAAYVDGADGWTRFRTMLLPLLAPTTFFVTVTTLIAGLQAFSEPYALIRDNNPTLAKYTSVYYLYNKGFQSFQMGYSSAVAWAVFVLIFIITMVQFRLSNSNKAYTD
jgi:ABC-type sugar transport system permease subunit